MTKLHLGLTPWNFSNLSARSLSEQAQFAEQCGYQSLWLPENHFGESALPDPLTLLAAAAGATANIRLGTTSYLLTLRNPLQAAEQVAVFDQMSGGRLILGVGRGYAPGMLRAFHVPVAEISGLAAFMQAPHPPMPDMSLTRREVGDLVAYIDSLKTEKE